MERRAGGPTRGRATRLAAVALAVAWLAAGARPVEAQRHRAESDRWAVDLRVGAASPKGDLGDVNDDGLLAGLAVSHWVHPQLALRVEGTFENLERGGRPDLLGGARGPQTDLWHYTVGVEALFTHPMRTDWRLGVDLGLGGTYLDVDPGLVPPGVEVSPEVRDGFDGHELTARGAVVAGYRVVHGLTLYGQAGTFALFGDADDPSGSFLGKEVVFTHEAGLRIGF